MGTTRKDFALDHDSIVLAAARRGSCTVASIIAAVAGAGAGLAAKLGDLGLELADAHP
jgi:hypothetical protein